MIITPGQAADLHEHLRTVHGQVRITADEATDPGFLLALHRIVLDQNPDEGGPVCAPYTHRAGLLDADTDAGNAARDAALAAEFGKPIF